MLNKLVAKSIFVISIMLFVSSHSEAASTRIISDKITEAGDLLRKKAEQYGVEDVLVVFDIDHTLLTPYSDLGASFWFKWQVGLIETPEREPEQIAASLEELGALTTKILCAVEFRPVETQSVSVYSNVLRQKFPIMFLTARSPDLREPTERELKLNHYVRPSSIIGENIEGDWKIGVGGYTGGLTSDEIVKAKLENPRPISYRNGIMMTNEQDKGVMLKALLHRFQLGSKYKAIVLIDDSKGNCESLERAYDVNATVDLTTFFYTKEHPRFDSFKAGDHWAAIAEWERVKGSQAFRKAKRNHCD